MGNEKDKGDKNGKHPPPEKTPVDTEKHQKSDSTRLSNLEANITSIKNLMAKMTAEKSAAPKEKIPPPQSGPSEIPESPAPVPPMDFVKFDSPEVGSCKMFKNENSSNRHRYESVQKIGAAFQYFRESWLLGPESQNPELISDWNSAIQLMKAEIERILMAECHGWPTVRILEELPISEDPEREKEILKAAGIAKKKAPEEKRKSTTGKFRNPRRFSNRQQGFQLYPQVALAYGAGSTPFIPAAYTPPAYPQISYQPPVVRTARAMDQCYSCGQLGHFRNSCPNTPSTSKQQSSKSNVFDNLHCNFSFYADGSELEENSSLKLWVIRHWHELEHCKVKFSLKRNIGAWRQVTSSDFILSVLQDGYKPPFSQLPPPRHQKNNMSTLQHYDFVLTSVAELLLNGFAKLVKTPPRVINPISVAVQSSGKLHLICDLRHINAFLDPPKFKMEDLSSAIPAFSKGAFAFSFDLMKGYYHIDLNEQFQTYFGFSFEVSGTVYYSVYTVAPFGLSTVPWLFTKLLKPWVKQWRNQGMHIFVYLDDGLCVSPSRHEATLFASLVRRDLLWAGIWEQATKCTWDPVQVIKWLGFIIDLLNFELIVPQDKITRALASITEALNGKLVTPRQICRAAGLLNSLALVLGKLVYMHTKPLFRDIVETVCWQSVSSWNRSFKLSDQARRCLDFWQRNLPRLAGKRSLSVPRASNTIFSDASSTGGAAFRTESSELDYLLDQCFSSYSSLSPAIQSRLFNTLSRNQVSLTSWSRDERNLSSTWRELKVIQHGLHSLKDDLQNSAVRWFTDSLSGYYILKKGSMKPELNRLAIEIMEFCSENNIHLDVHWLRWDNNTTADKLSRIVDLDDWSISDELFLSLSKTWGPYTHDRFADEKNHKLPVFNSRFQCEGSDGVDAFSFFWGAHNNWLVPPPCLIPDAISHLIEDKAKGTLVAPAWSSNRFWPFIFGQDLARPYVKDWFFITPGCKYVVPGSHEKSIFSPDRFKGSLIAVRLDASA